MNYKVLVVEDFAATRTSFGEILDVLGLSFDTAADGLEAIFKLQKDNFDLILMDLQMPILNGFETTEHIRRNLSYPINAIPIIVMTGWEYASELKDTYKSEGFDGFLQKPFSLVELENAIKNVIEEREKENARKLKF